MNETSFHTGTIEASSNSIPRVANSNNPKIAFILGNNVRDGQHFSARDYLTAIVNNVSSVSTNASLRSALISMTHC